MDYSLVTVSNGEKSAGLQLSGSLTIRNARQLHAELLVHAREREGLHLEVKGVEEIDVAFIQMLLSLQQYQLQQKQAFSLQLKCDGALHNLLQLAGIEKHLSTNLQ